MGLMPRRTPFTIKPMKAIDPVLLDQAAAALKKEWPDAKPALGIILGSGWGDAVADFTVKAELPYEQIPGLGLERSERGSANAGQRPEGVAKTYSPGHAGQLLHVEYRGVELFVFQGRRHVYEGEGWTPVVLPIWLLKQFGAKTVLLTNASGGIREDLRPGTLMAIEDHINLLGGNPLAGPHHPAFGERFPDQTAIYDHDLRQALIDVGADASGIYLAVHGPTFETPAEIRAFRALGADAVGMSTVPEAILANALGMKVAGLTCVCNWAAGLGDEKLTADDVLQTAKEAMPRMRELLRRFIEAYRS